MKESKYIFFTPRNIYVKILVILLVVSIIFLSSCAKTETDSADLKEPVILKENEEDLRFA